MSRRLTFILSDAKNEIDIEMTMGVWRTLICYLQRLQKSKSPLPQHDHLATESWAGHELTDETEGGMGTVLHQVTLRLVG